ncbi:hypothetical protein ACVI1T_006091 [Rhizobium redzepovicii]
MTVTFGGFFLLRVISYPNCQLTIGLTASFSLIFLFELSGEANQPLSQEF